MGNVTRKNWLSYLRWIKSSTKQFYNTQPCNQSHHQQLDLTYGGVTVMDVIRPRQEKTITVRPHHRGVIENKDYTTEKNKKINYKKLCHTVKKSPLCSLLQPLSIHHLKEFFFLPCSLFPHTPDLSQALLSTTATSLLYGRSVVLGRCLQGLICSDFSFRPYCKNALIFAR